MKVPILTAGMRALQNIPKLLITIPLTAAVAHIRRPIPNHPYLHLPKHRARYRIIPYVILHQPTELFLLLHESAWVGTVAGAGLFNGQTFWDMQHKPHRSGLSFNMGFSHEIRDHVVIDQHGAPVGARVRFEP
jgi:hypothetical protein